MSNLRIEAFIPPKISTADHSRRERAIEMKKHRQRLGFFRYISFLYTVMVRVVIQHFSKNTVISMVLGHPNSEITCIPPS